MSALSTDNGRNLTKVIINDAYLITNVLKSFMGCRIYKGVDIHNHLYVNIYVKSYSNQSNSFVTGSKEQLKEKLCPRVIWAGTQTIAKHFYQIQVHQKFGPSLEEIFFVYKNALSQSTIYLLGYQLIRLIEKSSQIGYVCHNIDFGSIILHSDPQKTDLYLFNTLFAKKKNEECSISYQKYSSIASHLGLSIKFDSIILEATFKDDLQSVCYILIDLYTNRKFFANLNSKQYFDFKNNLKISDLPQLPSVLLDLFVYVRNINHNDQINYSLCKGAFKKRLTKSIILKPYQWVSISKIKKNRQQGTSLVQHDYGSVITQPQLQIKKNEENKQNQQIEIIYQLQINQKQIGSDDETIGSKVLKNSDYIWGNLKAKISCEK